MALRPHRSKRAKVEDMDVRVALAADFAREIPLVLRIRATDDAKAVLVAEYFMAATRPLQRS